MIKQRQSVDVASQNVQDLCGKMHKVLIHVCDILEKYEDQDEWEVDPDEFHLEDHVYKVCCDAC